METHSKFPCPTPKMPSSPILSSSSFLSILSTSAPAAISVSRLNPNASAYASASASETVSNPLERALERLKQCQFSEKDTKQLSIPLSEWYSSSTLDKVLTDWEKYGEQKKILDTKQQVPLTFVSYNVQGWATRGLEVLDLIHKVDASFSYAQK